MQDENAWLLKGAAGHAGLFSNVPDLLRFAAEILAAVSPANAQPGAPRLFDADTVELFAQRQGPEGSSRALGWDTPSAESSSGRYFSPHSIGHLGFSGCSLWIDLEAGIAVVLLTNRTWPDREQPADPPGSARLSRCRPRSALIVRSHPDACPGSHCPAEFSLDFAGFQIQSKVGDIRDANQLDDAGDGRHPS